MTILAPLFPLVFQEPGMSAAPAEMLSLRRFGDDQIVTLAKLAIENAFQPIAEIATGAVFGS